MNRKLERNQLKKNFLQEIIIRLDFQGVLQPEMEKVLLIAKPYLKEKSFKRYNEIVNNQTIVEGTSPKDFSSPITYTFMDDNYGFALALSTTSIVMSIQSEVYSPFENYSEIFSYIASLYNEEIDFLLSKGLGLGRLTIALSKEYPILTNTLIQSILTWKNQFLDLTLKPSIVLLLFPMARRTLTFDMLLRKGI